MRKVIDEYEGVEKEKGIRVKKWWKGVSVEERVFRRVVDAGDLVVVQRAKEFHYALVVRNYADEEAFLVFYYDCEK